MLCVSVSSVVVGGGWASMPQSRATFVGASTSAPSDSYGGSGGSGASEDAHRRATGGSSDMPEDLVAGVARLAVGGQKKSTVGMSHARAGRTRVGERGVFHVLVGMTGGEWR